MAEWLTGKQKPLATVSLSMHDIVFIKKRKGILMQIWKSSYMLVFI